MKKILACVMACLVCMSFATQAFALGTNVNSVGSVAADVADDVAEDAYGSEVTGKDETQQKESEYQTFEVADDTVTANVDVYATQATGEDVYDPENPEADPEGYVDGAVMVIVPKVVILDGQTGEGAYVVKVKGNIAGNEVITVAPDATVAMKQTGKDDVVATITQDAKTFAVPTATDVVIADMYTVTTSYDDTVANATIVASGLTAGQWHGQFAFNISFATIAA